MQEYIIKVTITKIPVFVKSGTILPLAKPTLHTEDPESWHLTAFVYGENSQPAVLFEEDGSLNPELNEVKLLWDNKKQKGNLVRDEKYVGPKYSVIEWKYVR